MDESKHHLHQSQSAQAELQGEIKAKSAELKEAAELRRRMAAQFERQRASLSASLSLFLSLSRSVLSLALSFSLCVRVCVLQIQAAVGVFGDAKAQFIQRANYLAQTRCPGWHRERERERERERKKEAEQDSKRSECVPVCHSPLLSIAVDHVQCSKRFGSKPVGDAVEARNGGGVPSCFLLSLSVFLSFSLSFFLSLSHTHTCSSVSMLCALLCFVLFRFVNS